MSAGILLSRLEGVRRTGPDRWLARCPAHEDQNPSLSIRETSDGTILIHDFAGCCPSDILAAVGLSLADLFPGESKYEYRKGKKPSFNARDLLELVRHELAVLIVWLAKIDPEKPLSGQDAVIIQRAKDSLVKSLQVLDHA